MKKYIASFLLIALLLTGCGADESQETTLQTEIATDATTEPEAVGVVRLLTLDPQTEETFLKLAEQYSEFAGVEVEVTVADSLPEKMDKEAAPALFFGSEAQLADRTGEYLDLTGTAALQELIYGDMVLTDGDGTVKAMAAGCAAFGMLVNKPLLEQSGHFTEEIFDFASLKFVVEDIEARSEELGIHAFAPVPEESLPYLANIPAFYESRDGGSYLTALRNILDLAQENSDGSESGLTTFTEGKAVFSFGGSWDQDTLDPEVVGVLPLYCGVDGEMNAGMSTVVVDFWAVNAQASPEDLQAALGFWYWILTSREGVDALSGLYACIPYKSEPRDSWMMTAAEDYAAAGRYNIDWMRRLGGLTEAETEALDAYFDNPTDENWEAAETAFQK